MTVSHGGTAEKPKAPVSVRHKFPLLTDAQAEKVRHHLDRYYEEDGLYGNKTTRNYNQSTTLTYVFDSHAGQAIAAADGLHQIYGTAEVLRFTRPRPPHP